jgi:uncharacterized membrane protein
MITWTRSELKEQAKSGLQRNYWKSVLAGLLLTIALGAGGIISYSIDLPLAMKNLGRQSYYSYENDSNYPESDFYPNDNWNFDGGNLPYGQYGSYNGSGSVSENAAGTGAGSASVSGQHTDLSGHIGARTDYDMSDAFTFGVFGLVFGMIVFLAVIIAAIAIVGDIFLLNPLEAGVSRFMLINLHQNADIKEVGYAFDRNYKNTMSTMFFRDLYIFLWSLLFVIPGIVKSYEYRMIPYLLIDNPGMSRQEAFARSKAMMNGQKWRTFVLDLSFLGWDILSAITFGIVGLFYVVPYQAMTNAALYDRLRGGIQYQSADSWNPQGPNGWNPQTPNGWNPQTPNNWNPNAQNQNTWNPNAQNQNTWNPNTQNQNTWNPNVQNQNGPASGTCQTPSIQSLESGQPADSAPAHTDSAQEPADSTPTPSESAQEPADSTPTPSNSAQEYSGGRVSSDSGENPATNSENDNTTTTANP